MTLDDLGDRIFAYVPEVADITGLDERTIRKAAAAGEIPAHRIGAKWMIPTAWLREQAGQPVHTPAVAPDLGELADLLADRVLARLARLFGGKVGSESQGAV
jgi:excisionase family DNA binding protein